MSKLYKELRKPLLKGLLGVEIEVEGVHLPRGNFGMLGDWVVTKDGSLRGENAEYVLAKPLSLIRAKSAIKSLTEELKQPDVQINWSFRTSVHVHVNCLALTKPQVNNIIYTYLLLEQLMLHYCGESRQNNRFCLRVNDAQGLLQTLKELFAQKDWYFPPQDVNRYASINVDALSKFGSLEFRGMRGCVDQEILFTWLEALVRIRSYAIESESVGHISGDFMSMQDREWVELVLGEAITNKISAGLSAEKFSQMLSRNFSLTAALLYA